jgi:hypothetical protein
MANKQYLKERREMLIRNHFCVDCKTQDARTLMGRARCYECLEKARIRRSGIKYTRAERKELGLCSICGKKVKVGFAVCDECYKRIKKASVASHVNHTPRPPIDRESNPPLPRSEWVENGFCRTCGDKALDGYKVCESCRQHLIDIRIRQKELGQDSFLRNTMNFTSNF